MIRAVGIVARILLALTVGFTAALIVLALAVTLFTPETMGILFLGLIMLAAFACSFATVMGWVEE